MRHNIVGVSLLNLLDNSTNKLLKFLIIKELLN